MNRSYVNLLLQPLARVAAATCTVIALCAALPALSQVVTARPQARITASVDNSVRATLAGSHPPRAIPADDIGALPSTTPLNGISVIFSRSASQQAALDALVAAQQNPASPLYHQWITPDQYAAQFGAAASDIAAVKTWLEQQGFTVDFVSRSNNRIVFSGNAGQVANAFGTPLHYYLAPSTAVQPAATHFAPSADISIPAALAPSVLAIGNLSSFHPRPHILQHRPASQPRFTSSQTGNHYLTPGDLATIYNITPAYDSGYVGSNQNIAVVGQSEVNMSDITNFQTAVGIAAKAPIAVLEPGSGTAEVYADGDEAESDLDLEYSSTIAKGAQVYFIYTGNSTNYGVFNALEYAIDTYMVNSKVIPVISTSYGECEPALGQSDYTTYNNYLEQAASQGQTVVAAAGDDGSTDCYGETGATDTEALAVDFPASSQYVTGMGGTEFPSSDIAAGKNTYFDAESTSDIISSAKSYIPETVWNDDVTATADSCPGTKADPCTPISSGGGGVSIYTAQPTWQAGTIGGVAISTSGGKRMVPDIALVASPYNAPLAFCTSDTTFWQSGQKASCNDGLRDSSSGDLTVGGGTSFDAPTFSGLVAILNQYRNSAGQGVINSTLYSIATTSAYASAFHDITSGGNQCDSGSTYCSSAGESEYAATTGYDEASGLGSLNFANLLAVWPSVSPTSTLLATSTTLTAAANNPASGVADLITITVAPVTTTTSVPSGTVSIQVDGGTATAEPLTNGVATYSFSSTTAGSHIITANYSGDTLFAPSTGYITVTVGSTTSPGTFGLSSPSITLASDSSASGTITISPDGYTGTVNLAVSSTTLVDGCVTLGSSSVAITGTSSGTASYTVYTSPVPCPASGSARRGTLSASLNTRDTHRPSSPWRQVPVPASLAGALLLCCIGPRHRQLRHRLLHSQLLRGGMALGLLLLLSFSGIGLTGCGGGSTTTTTTGASTPAGSYTVTIVGTDSKSSTLTSSVTISITVT
ncbi:MAG: protease pro-enzyme activation domain-containing protein [Acidobacteriaceae bacterium]